MDPISLLLRPFLPWSVRWVQRQEAVAINNGRKLTAPEMADARRAGVSFPEKIYIRIVPSIEPPDHWLLFVVPKSLLFIGPQTSGLTLNYAIYIREDCADYADNRWLYVHEMIHVGQYERFGSIEAFLAAYLKEAIVPGYPHGPLEQEAIHKSAEILGEA
jgi:hypothetical protein